MEADRVPFDNFVKRHITLEACEDSFEVRARSDQYPTFKETLYEYFMDRQTKTWTSWEWIVPDYIHNATTVFSEILVPTVDTLRINHILSLMNRVISKVLL